MANMRAIEQAIPSSFDRTYEGVIVAVGTSGAVGVNVQGNVLPARWSDPVVVAVGDSVLVSINAHKTGPSEAIVRARIASGPRPPRATVKTVPGGDTITVTGTDGIDYDASYVTSYSPTVGDTVILSWNASQPSVVGKVAAPTAPPPAAPAPAPPPPPAASTGQTAFQASDSNTYWPPGGWGSWAGGKGRVYQGSYGSGQVYGAFFYGGATSQMGGRSISRLQIIIGSRLAVGSYNSPVTLHLYAHNSPNRPGGDVSRVVGPFDVTVWPGQGPTAYDLPGSFYATLQAGGGIAIAGEPYCGFLGRWEQPDSGKLIFDWSQ